MSDQPPGPASRGGLPHDPPSAPPAVPDWDALARLLAGEPARARGPEASGADDDLANDVAGDDLADLDVGDDVARDVARDVAAADAAARAWMAAHPDEAVRLRAADALGAAYVAPAAGRAAPVDVQAALARVHRQIAGDVDGGGETAAEPTTERPRLQVIAGGAPASRPARPATARPAPARPAWAARSRRWIAGGAALAAAAGLAVVAVRQLGPDASTLRYATATGARTSVRLPDGTRVVLGPSSTLASVGRYGDGARTLTLQGEAYFDVVHDDARPFVVRAGPAVVRDLGTAFVVRAGAETGRTTVTVTQGSVALTPAAEGDAAQQPARPARPSAADTVGAVLLRAGERGLVDRPAGARAGTALRARRLAPAATPGSADDMAWTTGRLVFRDAPLTEVGDALRRWYGLTLRVTDSTLAGRTLNAQFQGETPDQVLRVITLTLGARYDRRGDTVFVRTAR